MKSFIYFYKVVSLFAIVILCSTCKKSNTSPASLPPASQTGANTFGCKINGEVWVPYYTCESSGLDCSEMQVSVLHYTDSTGLKLNVGISTGRNINDKKSFLQMGFPSNKAGNIYDSSQIEYLDDNFLSFGKLTYRTGNLEITKLDTVNKIVSGIFSFTLYKGGANPDSVIITEGRFDVTLGDVCKCNQ